MRLTDFEKGRIIYLYQENFTQMQISAKMYVNQSTISRLLKKHNSLGTKDNLESSGRSKVFVDSDIDLVKK
jgi:IS30 family transposase